MNGYGERVGNANLVTILPNLVLKMGKHDALRAQPGAAARPLPLLRRAREPQARPKAPFVGQSAFAHKGGLHANAAQKVARSYEHIDPSLVGNRTRVLVSDMAGRSSLALKAREFGVELDEKSPELKGLIEELKEREFRGYEYEAADASFKLLVARKLGRHKESFEVEGYRVIVERHGGRDLVGGHRAREGGTASRSTPWPSRRAPSGRWTRRCASASRRRSPSCAT
jgi:2-isopropylmalate synthase